MQTSYASNLGAKRYIFGFVVLPFAVATMMHALRVTSGIPLADEWRWFADLLIPYFKGEISFVRYLTGEYSLLSHTHFPALGLLYLTCARWSCSLAVFTYVGLAAMLIGGGVLTLQAVRAGQRSIAMLLCGLTVLAAGCFCITNDFPWLLVVFEYVYSLVAICYLCFVDRYLHARLPLPSLLILTAITILCGDTVGLAAVILSVAVFVVGGVRQPRLLKAAILIMLVCLVLAALALGTLGTGVPVGVHSRSETLAALFANPCDLLASLLHAFAQPLLDRVVLESLVGQRHLRLAQAVLGAVGLGLTAMVLVAWWRQKNAKISHLPVLFVLFGLLMWLLIITSRYLDGGPYLMDAQRYVRNLAFVYVGAGLALASLAPTRLTRSMAIAFSTFVTTSFVLAAVYQYRNAPYVLSYFENVRALLLSNPGGTELSSVIERCTGGYCAPTVEYLRGHGMTAFLQR